MQENNNHFDDKIKSSLEGLQVPYNAAHWEGMNARLNAAHFDQIAKEKMQHTQAPLQMAAWERIASTMDIVAARKKVIYQSKLIELCLLLLLWSVAPFVAMKEVKEGENNPKEEFKNSKITEIIAEVGKINNTITQNSTTSQSTPPRRKYITTQQPNTEYQQFNNNNNNNTSNLPWHEQPTTTITSFENTEIINATTTELLQEQAAHLPQQNAPMIAVLSPQLLEQAATQRVPLFAILKAAKLTQLKRQLRLGVYGASDKQTIITSDVQIFGKGLDLTQTKHTYSGGITLGIKRNQFEIETGLEYTRLQYEPKAYFTQTATYIRQSLQPIRLELVRIPLMGRYDFHYAERFTTYIAVGAALNLATRANYDHSEYGQTIFGRQAAASNDITKTPNHYPDGLLAGGRFLNNSYLSTSLSVGLEYTITPQYSCYLQPIYSWDIRNKGIGVTQDKIETLSLRVGLKKKF